jgi:hypothetical protein
MDYKNGKIYKIIDIAYTTQYIGSTTQTLSRRFSKHKSNYKVWQANKINKISVFDIFEKFGIENCKIELIEAFPCDNRDELERKEGEFIKNNDCVNKYIAGRTKKEYNKEYYDANKNKILEYREANKDKIKEKAKEYYDDNKDKLAEYAKEKIMCECGCEITRSAKSRHIKSKKHIKYIETEI